MPAKSATSPAASPAIGPRIPGHKLKEFLACGRTAAYHVRKVPGFPKADVLGTYPAAEVRDFVDNKLTAEAFNAAKARRATDAKAVESPSGHPAKRGAGISLVSTSASVKPSKSRAAVPTKPKARNREAGRA